MRPISQPRNAWHCIWSGQTQWVWTVSAALDLSRELQEQQLFHFRSTWLVYMFSHTPLLSTCRNLVVMFACHHCVCPDCFQQYCRETLITRRFEQDPNVGYTIKCPGKVGVQVGTLCKKGCYTLCITLISSVLHMCNSAYRDVIPNIDCVLRLHTHCYTVSYNNYFYTVVGVVYLFLHSGGCGVSIF